MAEAPAPRLVVTDALGRRIVPIDKPLFTMGRRSETDLRLPGADISRVHAEITLENGTCTIRDKQSRFGTFVNGERTSERVLTHGDTIRLGAEAGVLPGGYLPREAGMARRAVTLGHRSEAGWSQEERAARVRAPIRGESSVEAS